jgi:DNA-binding GntR family transcriptional regulator
MSEFEKTTLSQRIAEEIAMKISEGILKPGERLLENELMGIFGTSRAPIREAMFILEKDGLAERIPRRGVFVKSYTKKQLNDLYDAVYRLQEIAVRKIIEVSVPDTSLDELSKLVAKMDATIPEKKVKKYFQFVEEFILLLFDLSGNAVLKDFYLKIDGQLTPFRYISLSHPSSLDCSVEEFKLIVKGIQEKDYQLAERSLRQKEKRALSILEKVV